jgi:hypothetical protein
MIEPSVIQIGLWFLVMGRDWHHHEENHGEGRGYTSVCYGSFRDQYEAEALRDTIAEMQAGNLKQADLTMGIDQPSEGEQSGPATVA